ncbi:MAG TPA: hypothetical protein VFD95_09850 [Usitatibacter sp.]|jgi:putative transport protein|nr:hypothetical protein [Usitatibacter sp.]
MQPFLHWLASNSYFLLFVVVLAALLLGRVSLKGFGLGAVACAALIGALFAATGALMGVRLGVDGFTRSIFYSLFVFALGLRIGPSLSAAFVGDGPRFLLLALLCSALGFLAAVAFAAAWALPPGAAGGILAGAMGNPAAIGFAEEAIRQGGVALPEGVRFETVSAVISVSFALTIAWGVVASAIACTLLPRWWGVDLGAEAAKYEERFGVLQMDDAGFAGLRPLTVRAYRLTNETLAGWTVRQFLQKYPQYRILNVLRVEPARRDRALAPASFAMEGEAMVLAAAGVRSTTLLRDPDMGMRNPGDRSASPESSYVKLGAADDLALRAGDIVTLGGRHEAMPPNSGLIGPEVSDAAGLDVPMCHAEIVVTRRELEGRELGELRNADFAGQLTLHHIERGGVPLPLGLNVKLRRHDVLFVAGVQSAVNKLALLAGRIARPDALADLVIISAGMALGLALGAFSLPVGEGRVGLGNAGGLLLAGVIVSLVASRLGFVGSTPCGARCLLEDLGLVAFVAIVGLEAGAVIALQVPEEMAVRIVIAGIVTATLPLVAAWAIGHHVLGINPALLLGAVAGTRAHQDAARDAARRIGSSVPWIGFPVAGAAAAVLVPVFAYVAMVVAR